MSIKNFLEVWGFIDKPKTVQSCLGSTPNRTEGNYFTDDGSGWTQIGTQHYEREIRTSPPPYGEWHKWQQVSTGVWTLKAEYR